MNAVPEAVVPVKPKPRLFFCRFFDSSLFVGRASLLQIPGNKMARVIVGQFAIEFLTGTFDTAVMTVFDVFGRGNCLPGLRCSLSRLNGPYCAVAFWGGGDVTLRMAGVP
jgi:hypothetical protein